MHRLLVVDDEPEYLDELVEALSFRGLAAISVARGAEALEVLAREPTIRMVLTDIRMPDMDGVQLIERARAAFPGRLMHFLVMTGHAAPVDIARATTAGAERCFPKPLAFEDLCDALSKIRGGDHAGT